MASYTPMIQQYLKIKAHYKDAFLFFRLGDFYEMFFDDAVKASKELEITLTSRDGGGADRIPMCGVPHHSAKGYIEQLVQKGYRVAICEQTEDPKQAKGVVKREVVQLITPGTIMETKVVEDNKNNFLTSISSFDNNSAFGLAISDLSTGETRVTLIHGRIDDVLQEIYALEAKEIVVDSDLKELIDKHMWDGVSITLSKENDTDIPEQFQSLVSSIKQQPLVIACGRLLQYLHKTQKRSLDHLQPFVLFETDQFMKIDYYSKRNLELTETVRSKGRKGSLLWLLDETVTAMGGRKLKQWLDQPLIHRGAIEKRFSIVETLLNEYFVRQELRDLLKDVYDLERLVGKVAFGNANARELLQLKKSLAQVPSIVKGLESLNNPYIRELMNTLDPCEDLKLILEQALQENPPISVTEGDLLKDGYNELLDKYRDASRNGKSWIAQLEKQEKEATGIKSLKVGYNRIFGYYIEVTRANLHLLSEGRYERKQTLANAERFITPELKEKEALILEAEEKSIQLEYELFQQIREQVKTYISRLQQLAKLISEIDVYQSFATLSEQRHYTRPCFSEGRELRIINGRHPVVEKVMGSQEYVPNDCMMSEGRELLLITGPNMSGKSTYMRQVALTAILAQIGCFVPADEAVLPIFNQVFTRIGAADDLISGQSTFMVEMLEAKHAIMKATQNSLILFDEIGRGTSTYDGMALAQAIIEYIHNNIGAKTLFSTHYHELTALEMDLPQLKNIHVSAVEENGQVVFLHKLQEGSADKSYGIHVAQLAGLPEQLIKRAEVILTQLEAEKSTESVQQVNELEEREVSVKEQPAQLSLFADSNVTNNDKFTTKQKKVIDLLLLQDIMAMTPLDAMTKLYELQKMLK
ncbi:DNA mismatch repair protein MutS [Bacillus sp. HMF5848]|uniref:DNA mismatch repair protein MutS n=1 Tax=Bacillus sp. HMF5848 TaxID=2495421 RepID=UPI000F78F6FA|nr:DNA mismatch repair protein MutS [Bacillus sp. HMF5848]RSK27109.1 DNA mismatch repair protein MutS [Bacillus sp. HMF5848]